MLFVLFFLYRDGEQALRTLRHLVPLSAEEADRMGTRIADTILAIVNGSLTVAFVQALLVWGPVALFLVLTGSWLKAIILIAWGGLAVSTIDNLLYPYLVGGRLRLHTIFDKN